MVPLYSSTLADAVPEISAKKNTVQKAMPNSFLDENIDSQTLKALKYSFTFVATIYGD
jgi:hypothetical protein